MGYTRRGIGLTVVTLHENGRIYGVILPESIYGTPYCNTIGHGKTIVCGLKEPRILKVMCSVMC